MTRMLVVSVMLGSSAAALSAQTARVVVPSSGWELIGELRTPDQGTSHPTVLLLHQAAGSRQVYAELAEVLASRGIASLRLDLRGHGESINDGSFQPGEHRRDPLIWDAERDVIAALDFLRGHAEVDAGRIGIVGASYSGEEAAEAGRIAGYSQAYALLSPGSISAESIGSIDGSEPRWLVVATREDAFLQDIVAELQARATGAELWLLDGGGHATDLLSSRPELVDRLADWLVSTLR